MNSLLAKLRSGLSRTRTNLLEGIAWAVSGKTRLDEETLESLEERLIAADLGVETTLKVIDSLRQTLDHKDRSDFAIIIELLKSDLIERLQSANHEQVEEIVSAAKPHVVLVTGVNGVGKTTTIGKLANMRRKMGQHVVVGAADTYRAAASQQLEIWAERASVEVVRNTSGADPAAVAYDTIVAAQNRGADAVFVDTAGRLHTRSNLMEELKKIKRVIEKRLPGAPHEVILVLDATTGQNALVQAREFNSAVNVTGIVLTKLDGTAKGGIVFAIQDQLHIPVQFIGVGEQMDDLQPFEPESYVEALFT